MVDIWSFDGYDGKIKVKCKDGTVYSGYVAEVIDKNEDEEPEDSIAIYSDKGGIIGFDESEISSIVKM